MSKQVAVSTSDEVAVPNTERRVENFNDAANQHGLEPGNSKLRPSDINRIAQPNLNNSLLGSFRVGAVARLIGTRK